MNRVQVSTLSGILTPLWYNSVQQELLRRTTMTTEENNTVDNRQISKPTCTVVHSRETH